MSIEKLVVAGTRGRGNGELLLRDTEFSFRIVKMFQNYIVVLAV